MVGAAVHVEHILSSLLSPKWVEALMKICPDLFKAAHGRAA